MKITIHTAMIKDGRRVVQLRSDRYCDLIAKIGNYCRTQWATASSDPPPEDLRTLIDAFFANSDAVIDFSRECPDLPEPYASASKLLAALESVLAAYRPGGSESLAAQCREVERAKKVVAKASTMLVRAERVFTVFCQDVGGRGTVHIASVEAPDVEAAIETGKQQCCDDWSDRTTEAEIRWNLETIHCLGVAAGEVEILHWQDPPE